MTRQQSHYDRPHRQPETAPQDIPSPLMPSDLQPFIWQQLADVQRCLGRIEEGIDVVKGRLANVEEKTSKTAEKLNRILWVSAGAGTIIGIVVTIVTSLLRYLPK